MYVYTCAINDWNLRDQVKGMCFDTTSSNTGCKNGACVLLEQKLGIELLHLACRHHILEIVLEAVFSACIGPDILLFKRFQSKWQFIVKENIESAFMHECTRNEVEDISEEIISFSKEKLQNNQHRDDYKELLELTIIFLGGIPSRGIHIMAPGALHRARWMAKAIYSLKIWMYRGQFKLTTREEIGLKKICFFVVRVYVKAWFMANSASNEDSQTD